MTAPSKVDCDVVIIGAGAAGLAALGELDRAGCPVLCVEARERIGGRVLTVHDPLSPLPLELGAEFIHGRPPEIWDIVRTERLPVYDCADASVRICDGQVQKQEDAWLPMKALMREMSEAASTGPDQSFDSFLKQSDHAPEAKELSTSFVEGFNAARKEVIGIASLAKDAKASEQIDGDRSFRFSRGYDAIPLHLLSRVCDPFKRLRLNTVVTRIEWKPGFVLLQTVSALTGSVQRITARRLVITLPLGVLTAVPRSVGAIEWDPAPTQHLQSAQSLAFGQVARMVFRFRQAFWEEKSVFADAGFLVSNEALFPTWWTPLGTRAPILTGWSAGPHADGLLGLAREQIIREAIKSLARILAVHTDRIERELEAVYYHDWYSDPFARGAYSYVPSGAMPAREQLAQPVSDTLYFAGEATELNGHSATVHGAIASGVLAARRILEAR